MQNETVENEITELLDRTKENALIARNVRSGKPVQSLFFQVVCQTTNLC